MFSKKIPMFFTTIALNLLLSLQDIIGFFALFLCMVISLHILACHQHMPLEFIAIDSCEMPSPQPDTNAIITNLP
jgi:hypothetical protein